MCMEPVLYMLDMLHGIEINISYAFLFIILLFKLMKYFKILLRFNFG